MQKRAGKRAGKTSIKTAERSAGKRAGKTSIKTAERSAQSSGLDDMNWHWEVTIDEEGRQHHDLVFDDESLEKRWHDFGQELRASLESGDSTLKADLREELDRLLEGAA